MSAREKLNIAYLIGAVILAALVGGMASSAAVFGTALALLVMAAVFSGDIRPPR
ncbi:MAG: hypothetical protein K1X74_17455 [Pirellulales bacterium]|nr:hypothetical protein [Pirellulales bacterium]